MLVNSVPLTKTSTKMRFKEESKNLKTANKSQPEATTLKNMPNYSDMVSFCRNNENMGTFYKAYKEEMPETLRKSCEEKSEEELSQITDVYGYYRKVYADMQFCTTVEDLKEKFPQEFKNLKSALGEDVKGKKGSFLAKIQDLTAEPRAYNQKILLNNGVVPDQDLSVYLAKKLFFEVKTKEEIVEDFSRDINKNLHPDVLEYLNLASWKTDKEKCLIPDNVYTELGLILPKEQRNFRASLLSARKNFDKARYEEDMKELKLFYELKKQIGIQ